MYLFLVLVKFLQSEILLGWVYINRFQNLKFLLTRLIINLYFPHFDVNSLDVSSTSLPYHSFHYYYYQANFEVPSRLPLWLMDDSVNFLLTFNMNFQQSLQVFKILYILNSIKFENSIYFLFTFSPFPYNPTYRNSTLNIIIIL